MESRVAAGSRDGPLACVWATATGKLASAPIRGHDDKVRAVSLGGNGQILLTASDDGLAKVWNIAGAEPRQERVLESARPGDPEAQADHGGRAVAGRGSTGDSWSRRWAGRALGV